MQRGTLSVWRPWLALVLVFGVLLYGSIDVLHAQEETEAEAPPIIEQAPRQRLGILAQDVTPELAEDLELPEDQAGVLVEQVEAGVPAEMAGIAPGDVIVGFNDEEIASIDELRSALEEVEPGDEVTVTVLREGEEVELDVAFPAVEIAEQQPTAQAAQRGRLGIRGADLTPDVVEELELPEDQEGVLVQEIVAGTPAEEAGIEVDDIITTFNDEEIAGIQELRSAVQGVEPGEEVTITVLRDGEEEELGVTFPEAAAQRTLPTVALLDAEGASIGTVDLTRTPRDRLLVEIMATDFDPLTQDLAIVDNAEVCEAPNFDLDADVILDISQYRIFQDADVAAETGVVDEGVLEDETEGLIEEETVTENEEMAGALGLELPEEAQEVALEDLTGSALAFTGMTVRVEGPVERVLDPTDFIANATEGDLGVVAFVLQSNEPTDNEVLVLTAEELVQPASLEDQDVMVTGLVLPFNLQLLEMQTGLDLIDEEVLAFEGGPLLIAMSVEEAAGEAMGIAQEDNDFFVVIRDFNVDQLLDEDGSAIVVFAEEAGVVGDQEEDVGDQATGREVVACGVISEAEATDVLDEDVGVLEEDEGLVEDEEVLDEDEEVTGDDEDLAEDEGLVGDEEELEEDDTGFLGDTTEDDLVGEPTETLFDSEGFFAGEFDEGDLQVVSLADLTGAADVFAGSFVRVEGEVEDLVGNLGFTIESDELVTNEVLVLSPVEAGFGDEIREVEGSEVVVTGEVIAFNLADVEEELGFELDEPGLEQFEGQAAILADTVGVAADEQLEDGGLLQEEGLAEDADVGVQDDEGIIEEEGMLEEEGLLGDQEEVTALGDLAEDPEAFENETLTVEDEVGRAFGARAFTLGAGDEETLIVTSEMAGFDQEMLTAGTRLRAIGEAGVFDAETFEQEFGLRANPTFAQEFAGRPFLAVSPTDLEVVE